MASETNSEYLPPLEEFSETLRFRLGLIDPAEIELDYSEGEIGGRVIECSCRLWDTSDIQYEIHELSTREAEELDAVFQLVMLDRTGKPAVTRWSRLQGDGGSGNGGEWATADSMQEARGKIADDWNARQLSGYTKQVLVLMIEEDMERTRAKEERYRTPMPSIRDIPMPSIFN